MKTFFCSTALLFSLFAAIPASADGGTINFTGGVAESGCTVNVVPDSAVGTVPVAPGINLQVRDENDACSRGYSAFTAQVGTLNAGETGVQNNVITLTYN
jgi:type 1 fimbria pilin